MSNIGRAVTTRSWQAAQSGLGGLIEGAFAPPAHSRFSFPPIFIIGPPRSGSTLLIQVLTDAFQLAYLTNQHARWFGAPALAERHLAPLRDKKPSDYKSHHGGTSLSYAPAECGAWWYRYFPRVYPFMQPDQPGPAKMEKFRRSLLWLDRAAQLPFIYKNLYAVHRLRAIQKHVPEALFVVISRNIYDNALSILKARHSANGNFEQWWSVPVSKNVKNSSAAVQVVSQIESVHDIIERDLNGSSKVFHIDYDEFCRSVPETLNNFSSFLANLGIDVDRRFDVPETFQNTARAETGVPGKIDAELRALVNRQGGD